MLEIIIVLICLILNAVLSATEMAFISLSKATFRQLNRAFPKRTRRLRELRENPERVLSVIQIGITLVGIVAGAMSGAGVEERLVPWFQERLGWGPTTSELVGIFLVVIPLTALTVILGELVPKSLALRRPFEIASGAAVWLKILDRVLHPVVSLFEITTKRIVYWLQRAGIGRRAALPVLSETSEKAISKHHEEYLLNLAKLETRSVTDILVPWSEVIVGDLDWEIDPLLAVVIDSGHTRLPICREGKVKGLINTKEVIAFASQGGLDWQLLLRSVLLARREDSLIRILKTMQERRSHLTVIQSDQGEPLGIVTLEDIFEEIIGDIADEDDDQAVERLLASRAKLKRIFHPPKLKR